MLRSENDEADNFVKYLEDEYMPNTDLHSPPALDTKKYDTICHI